jgi:pimeloyl-ACP methyl ester carboxylesterase
MKYFTTGDEDIRLDAAFRARVRGDFAVTEPGVTHYELAGPEDGDVVLLVGGLTIPYYYWDGFATALHQRGYRTLAYSTFGRGYSDRVRGTYDEPLFIDQVTALCGEIGVTPAHLVGTSMGALIAMAYLREHSRGVASLSLVGPAGLDSSRPLPLHLLRTRSIGRALAKRFGGLFLDHHLSHNVRDARLSAQLTSMVKECYRVEGSMYSLVSTLVDFPLFCRHDLYRHHSTSGLPTMLAWGAEDDVTPIDRLDEVTTILNPRRIHVLDRCGHMAPYEMPVVVAEHVTTFVETVMRER